MDNFLEWIGYIGSLIVLISLLMSSIKKLRWINLVGAVIFAFYGFMIASIPTGFMNVGIVIIDLYYLVKMYKSKDFFRILEIEKSSDYFKQFLDFYREDIVKYTEIDEEKLFVADVRFYILRNMTPASVFVANKFNEDTLEIELDYAIPLYRDFKIGKFVFDQQKDVFAKMNFKNFIVFTTSKEHIKYVKKMGFVKDQNTETGYIKSI